VNGAPYPTLSVSPRRYRFQTLNAAQARFYNLQLYVADQSADGIALTESADLDNHGNRIEIPKNPAGPRIIQIGKDSGLLPAPAQRVRGPQTHGYLVADDDDPRNGNASSCNLLLAPGERATSSSTSGSSRAIDHSQRAPAPFPMGDIRSDYYAARPTWRASFGSDRQSRVMGRTPES
jgi:hypothetical protein